jgi:transposase-like protein
MPGRRRGRPKLEEIFAKLRKADVLVDRGQSVAEAIRTIGVSEVTYYRWRRECGGLKTDQVRRMKDLETENQRLRKAIADLTLDKLILQEAARLTELTRTYGRYGCRKVAALLRAAGWRVNDKRVERLWRQEGLKVPARQPKN